MDQKYIGPKWNIAWMCAKRWKNSNIFTLIFHCWQQNWIEYKKNNKSCWDAIDIIKEKIFQYLYQVFYNIQYEISINKTTQRGKIANEGWKKYTKS